jgi:hypothetical protein
VSARPIGTATTTERDLIDRIAEALPVEVRADYYRELRHCRSLPDNDEMLRILRAMQFLTLLIHQAPARMTTERGELDRSLNRCITALKAIEERLESLPQEVASSIGPEKVAGRINESLRQQFVKTTIPESAKALTIAAADIKGSVAEFSVASREIAGKQRTVAAEASDAVRSIASSIDAATRRSQEATSELTRSLLYLSWTSLVAGGVGLFALGLIVGRLYL